MFQKIYNAANLYWEEIDKTISEYVICYRYGGSQTFEEAYKSSSRGSKQTNIISAVEELFPFCKFLGDKGFVHCDLHSENIVIDDKTGHARIIDYEEIRQSKCRNTDIQNRVAKYFENASRLNENQLRLIETIRTVKPDYEPKLEICANKFVCLPSISKS